MDREKVIKGIETIKQFFGYGLPSTAEVFDSYYGILNDAIAMLKEQEAVVRCKDCKRRGTYDCPVYVGGDGMCSEPDDWFCADGERKEGR